LIPPIASMAAFVIADGDLPTPCETTMSAFSDAFGPDKRVFSPPSKRRLHPAIAAHWRNFLLSIAIIPFLNIIPKIGQSAGTDCLTPGAGRPGYFLETSNPSPLNPKGSVNLVSQMQFLSVKEGVTSICMLFMVQYLKSYLISFRSVIAQLDWAIQKKQLD
jgi:hypothetical protein